MGEDGRRCCGPVERLVREAGVDVVPVADVSRGYWAAWEGHAAIFVPDWARGHDVREAMIARQALLLAVAAFGEARAVGMFAGALGLLGSGVAAD